MHRIAILWVLVALVVSLVTPMSAVQEQPSGKTAQVVNLNTATAQQLESLPGVGARTAERIIEYRQQNGGFKKAEELMNVRGIGEKSFLRLKALITVTPPKTEKANSQQ